MIEFSIDGITVKAQKGETILEVARRYGIYIPTMCYVSKTTPCASCRLCSVEVEGADGFVLSCNTPPTPGIKVTTNSQKLHNERVNIMKLYDVNHPLECGVCDKSGECDLQNKTLEFGVDTQNFSAKEQKRYVKHWNLIDYDPSLCILCEKCVHVCNEVIGDDAIEIYFGGYNSTIIPKNSDTLDCTFCGECIAVCPVGALVSSDFKYTSNAWELRRVPAICAHCSAGCSLEYDVKHTSLESNEDKIYRVKNNYEYKNLCGAGRFGFDFYIKPRKSKDEDFNKAVDALKNAKAVRFSSIITNEEALILQKLKEKFGFKLFNEDARLTKEFYNNFASTSGKSLDSVNLEELSCSDGVIVIGTQIATDNPAVRYAITTASKQKGAKVVYFHPVEDKLMQNVVNQFSKYEVGTEEGVLALIANELLKNKELPNELKNYFDNLDFGYIEAESSIGADEIASMSLWLKRSKNITLVAGNDLVSHDKAKNIAKILGVIDRYSAVNVLIVPKDMNTIGVSQICELDKDDENLDNVVGYNDKGDFIISSMEENADMIVPAINQQEGTVVSIDKKVLPTNVALRFDGYTLNDIANELGLNKELTIEWTKELGSLKGFKEVDFDSLENFYGRLGEDIRGYEFDIDTDLDVSLNLDDIDDLPEYNGVVIYNANPVLQFNRYTAKTKQLPKEAVLRGSKQFAIAAKLNDGDVVKVDIDGVEIKRKFEIDPDLKGVVGINPTFDLDFEVNSYRFKKTKLERVEQ